MNYLNSPIGDDAPVRVISAIRWLLIALLLTGMCMAAGWFGAGL